MSTPSTPLERLASKKSELRILNDKEGDHDQEKLILEWDIRTLEDDINGTQAELSPSSPNDDDYFAPQMSLPNHTRPASSSKTSMPPQKGFAQYAKHFVNGLDGHFASDSLSMNAPSWSENMHRPSYPLGAMDVLNEGDTNSASASSPDSNLELPRKRQKPDLSISDGTPLQTAFSQPTTPMTVATSSTTPNYSESSELPEISAVLRKDSNMSYSKLKEEQLAEMKMSEQRLQREKDDEKFARSLHHDLNEGNLFQQPSGYDVGDFNTSTFQTDDDLDIDRDFTGNLMSSPIQAGPSRRRANPQSFGRETSIGPSTYALGANTFVKREYKPPSSVGFHDVDSFSFPSPNYRIKTEIAPHETSLNSRLPVTGQRPIKVEEPRRKSKHEIEVIDLDSDSEIPPMPMTGLNSNNPIQIDSDDFDGFLFDETDYGAPHNQIQPYNNANASSQPRGLLHGASQIGQSIYNTATGMFESLQQSLVGAGGSSVYGNGLPGYSINHPSMTEPFSATEIANTNFALHKMDTADTSQFNNYVDRVTYLQNDPTRTKAEIKALLENIRPDEELPENREGTPEAMTYPLMEHQKLGLTWLKKMEESEQRGGILADEMGLGKTIQALALMVSRPSTDPFCKTTLIVAPVGLLRQWEREIKTKLKPGRFSLKTLILHGTNRLQSWDMIRTYDVVITTFGTLSSEFKRREDIEMKKRANPSWRPTSKKDTLTTLGDECVWYRVIIDEAQNIKNKTAKAAIAACLLKAKSRLCMTGTPMMNSIDELYSLIRFLRINPWMDSQHFRTNFSKPLNSQSASAKTQAMQKLQVLLKAILLRRTKKSEIDGKPIIDLPPRSTEEQHAEFSEDENEFYKALETRTQLQFNKYLKAGTIGRNYSNILVLLLRLRQACCHPHLIRDLAEKGFEGGMSHDEMIEIAKELSPEAVNRLIEQSKSNEDAALECPICMDVADNATIFIPCGHNTCSDCFTRIMDPTQVPEDDDAREPRNGEGKCPNCRGKVLSSKTIDHITFKEVHMNIHPTLGLLDELAAASESDESDDSSDDDDDVDADGNLKDFVVEDDEEADEDSTDDEQGSGYRAGSTPFEKASTKAKKSKRKGKAKANKPPKKSFAQLKKESTMNAKAKRRYLKHLEKTWETSAKIEKTMSILKLNQENVDPETKRPQKVIIFSLFTSLLDLLEVPIHRERWQYRRYDGSMNAKARNEAVEAFTDDPNITIMLISLKAGNSGLNLTAASQVIVFDPFWNPYIEEQAIDRAHRIGQQKPVEVHRILIKNTVEDRILALQEKKRELIESALDEGASKRIARLGTRDLAFLFVSFLVIMFPA